MLLDVISREWSSPQHPGHRHPQRAGGCGGNLVHVTCLSTAPTLLFSRNFLQSLKCLFRRVGNTLVKKSILRRVTGTDPSREARELSPG